MVDAQIPLTIQAPRQSRVGLIVALLLVLLSALLLWVAYQSWQLHIAATL